MRPFCQLLHFRRHLPRSCAAPVAPADRRAHVGPLRDACCAARSKPSCQTHDVYITDWVDARLVPLAVGRFDLDDYIDYVVEICDFLNVPGAPPVHVLAVCQPSVPVLAAVAQMEAENSPHVAGLDDPDGRPDRHPPQPDRGQQGRRKARARLVPAKLHPCRALPLSGRGPRGLSRLPPALRLHGDEFRPPCQRPSRHVQPSRQGRRRFGRETPRLL